MKGEGSYGETRKVIIRLKAREILTKYLRARRVMVIEKCPRNQAPFPAMRDEEGDFLSTNSIETGIKFDLRMCRRTFGHMLIDQGLNIDAVSVMMGHATTKTQRNTTVASGRKSQ